MDKEEILKLHTLSERKQKQWFIDNGVLNEMYKGSGEYDLYESLADCAFRLRDEAVSKSWVDWQVACAKIFILVKPLHTFESNHSEYSPGYWGNRAKPIHWIQAALLAKLESEVNHE